MRICSVLFYVFIYSNKKLFKHKKSGSKQQERTTGEEAASHLLGKSEFLALSDKNKKSLTTSPALIKYGDVALSRTLIQDRLQRGPTELYCRDDSYSRRDRLQVRRVVTVPQEALHLLGQQQHKH